MRRISEIAAEYVKNFAEDIKKQGASVYVTVVAATLTAWVLFPFVGARTPTAETTVIRETPFAEINCGSGKITLESLKGTSEESYSGYGYVPSVEARFDLSELSEADRYWLLKDGNLQASCIVRSKQNGIENMRLDVAGTKTDENGLTVLFGAGAEDEWRFPFDDMQTALSFIVTTEESAEGGLQRKSDFYVALDDALKPVRA